MLDVSKEGSCFHSYLITAPIFFFFLDVCKSLPKILMLKLKLQYFGHLM